MRCRTAKEARETADFITRRNLAHSHMLLHCAAMAADDAELLGGHDLAGLRLGVTISFESKLPTLKTVS